MKTGIYWQDPKYAVGRCFSDPSCILYLPLHKLDGASFMSKDAYGHLCTVTGALWRPNGRLFDGDDKIDLGNVLAFERTDAFSIIVNAKPSAVALDTLVAKQDTAGNEYRGYHFYLHNSKLKFMLADDNGDALRVVGDTVLVANTSYNFAATYDGSSDPSGVILYVNGAAEIPSTEVDTLASTIVSTTPLLIGDRGAHGTYYDGLIGEVRIYNRALTPIEIQHRYLATKWRYQ